MTDKTENQQITLKPDVVERIAKAVCDATAMDAFRLRIDATRKPTLTGTKLGGVPWWPAGIKPYPTTEEGQPLMLLAQLNMADFRGDPRLPGSGLVQFFIDSTDDCSGIDFGDPLRQDGFRIVWHEEIDPEVTEEDILAIHMPMTTDAYAEEYCLGNPVNGEFALDVEPMRCPITTADGRFDGTFSRAYEQVVGTPVPDGSSWWRLIDDDGYDAICKHLMPSEPNHLVLGYPFFTQYDPRGDMLADEVIEFDTLLLQIDSESEKGTGKDRVLWGDVGIANFFVNSEALRRGDFSRVMFNWDCY